MRERRAESAFLAASLVSLLLIVLASASVMTFEDAPESNISGFIASWFLAPKAAQNRNEIEALREEVSALRAAIERQNPRG